MEKIILIIVAMEDVELDYLKNKIINLKKIQYKSFNFYEGKIFDKKIVLCESKIGLINAATATTIAIEKYNPCIIINHGLAGGYEENIKVGDIVIGTESLNITSMEDKGTGEELENYEITTFLHNEENRLITQKADNNVVDIIRNYIKKENIHFGIIASGDIWNKNKIRIKYLNKKYNAICEDMESVAVYTVANNYNIPVVAIKGISNNEVLGEKYDANVGKNLQEFIIELIQLNNFENYCYNSQL